MTPQEDTQPARLPEKQASETPKPVTLFEAPPSGRALRRALPGFFILSLFGGVMVSPLAGMLPLLLAVALFYFHRGLRDRPRVCAEIGPQGLQFGRGHELQWRDIDRASVHEFTHQGHDFRLAHIRLGRFKSGELRRIWQADRPLSTGWRGARLIDPETLLINLKAFEDGGQTLLSALGARRRFMLSYVNTPPEAATVRSERGKPPALRP